LEFNQSEERKLITSLVNFALIGQNPIQSQSQSLVWYGLQPIRRKNFINKPNKEAFRLITVPIDQPLTATGT